MKSLSDSIRGRYSVRFLLCPRWLCLASSETHRNGRSKALESGDLCLTTKGFLKATNQPSVAGYFLTTKWYPGDKALYVVVYSSTHRTAGSVFTVFLSGTDAHPVFNVQNNGKFVRSRQADALSEKRAWASLKTAHWGIWTQEHIAMAIQEISRHERFETRTSELLTSADLPRCKSCADRK
jgi:hypothetical protein